MKTEIINRKRLYTGSALSTLLVGVCAVPAAVASDLG